MLIGVPKEIKDNEFRVGMAPPSVRELVNFGHSVLVEQNAGVGIGVSDDDYRAAGAEIAADAAQIFASAEMIVKVKEPLPAEYAMLREGQILFTYLHLAPAPELAKALLDSGVVGIAYETVTGRTGGLPLLAPMSEVAGRLSVQAGARFLERSQGGRGILMGGVPGVSPAKVVVIGGGVVGSHAIEVALGMGAEVTVIDRSNDKLKELWQHYGTSLRTIFATAEAIEEECIKADLVIGGVLVPGSTAPKLVTRELIAKMRPGTVVVDVAIDQGGCFETSRPTTHADPVFEVDGVVHYCVANMPGAVPYTSTMALNNATLPHIVALANKGWKAALRDDPHLAAGLNVVAGQIVHEEVARALDLPFMSPGLALSDIQEIAA